MIDQVDRFMKRQGMPSPGQRVLVAVSGGVDSMVLLAVLLERGLTCEVAHVDHGLRGAASDGDRSFVEAYCKQRSIPCHVRMVHPRTAGQAGDSTQMAARRLRLEALRSVATERGIAEIALAHHADDAVETLFLHLLRGMGLRGWGTIPPRSGPYIRPMLEQSRMAIEAFAKERSITFREDASNRDPAYLRNRVRHELLPALEGLRRGAGRVLRRDATMLRGLNALALERLEELTFDLDLELGIPLDRVRGSVHGPLLLQYLLRGEEIHPEVLDQLHRAVEEGRSGARFALLNGWLEINQEHIRSVHRSFHVPEPELVIEKDLHVPHGPLQVRVAQAGEVDDLSGPGVVWLDADKLEFPLHLRSVRPGDRIRLKGMSGHKRVMDLLAERRVPRTQRDRVPVVCDAAGNVVWVVGHRLAEGVKADGMCAWVIRLAWRQVPV